MNKIDTDLQLVIAMALAYLVESCELTENDLAKIDTVLEGLSEYDYSNENNQDTPSQVIDELIKNIASIQEKIDAYDDLEYSEGD